MNNEEKLPPDEEMEDEAAQEPDTDTGSDAVAGEAGDARDAGAAGEAGGAGEVGEAFEVPRAIPVAEPTAAPEPPPPPPPPPPAPPAPRIFPQQYTLLFASTCMLAGALTVWERHTVTGQPDMYGFQMIGGGLVFALAAYSVLTGLVSLFRGGVRFGGPLLAGFFALYFAIRSILRLVGHGGFSYFGDLKDELGFQEGVNTFLGQFGPGIWLEMLGGLVIFWLFFKAMIPKKKEETAPGRRRARR